MDQEIKKKWVEALRSGKFNQGAGILKYENKGKIYHCCLGVLCEVVNVPSQKDYGRGFYFDNEMCFLPSSVAEKANLPRGVQIGLSSLNDHNIGFPAIADYIETNF